MMAPLRGAGTGFAATLYETVAAPCPSCAPENETHVALVAIVHVHSRSVVIASEPVPPPGANELGDDDAVTWHLSEVGAVVDVEDELQRAVSRLEKTRAAIATISP